MTRHLHIFIPLAAALGCGGAPFDSDPFHGGGGGAGGTPESTAGDGALSTGGTYPGTDGGSVIGAGAGGTSAGGAPATGGAHGGAPAGAGTGGVGGAGTSVDAGEGGVSSEPSDGGVQRDGAAPQSCSEDDARRCGVDDRGRYDIEICDDGKWVPYTVCSWDGCQDARCMECSQDGVVSVQLEAQCMDGMWSTCVGGPTIGATLAERCTELAVLRWDGDSWATAFVPGLPQL